MSNDVPDGPGPARRPPRLWLHALLFIATVITTTANGVLYAPRGGTGSFLDGLWYSVPLLSILLCHEFGHYVAARLHGLDASLPYFIPLPPSIGLFGTMGAVIRMPADASRRKMIDIGAAGPLAGLAIAIPVTLYGLSLSEIGPAAAGGLQEGNSLLYAAMKLLVTGRWLPDGNLDVNLHPTAFAGWAGLFITMLNLLPFGQLDGGHIAVSYFGNRYNRIAPRFHPVLLVFAVGAFVWVYGLARRAFGGAPDVATSDAMQLAAATALQAGMPWLVWFGFLKLMRRMSGGVEHPPVEDVPLSRGRRALFWVVAIAFLLIFMPVPLRMSLPSADDPGHTQSSRGKDGSP